MTELHFSIEGMTCGGCSSGLAGLLEKAPGVSKVAISHETKSGDVVIDPAITNRDAIASVIEKAGYEVTAG